MKKLLLKVLFLFVLSPTINGQIITDSKKIEIKPMYGKIILEYNDSPLINDYQLYNLLNTANDPIVREYARKYKKRNLWMQVASGIGYGFVGIWMINEAFNEDFHSSIPEDILWKRIVIGTSLSFSITGIMLNRSAKRQLIHGIEHFNKY